MEGASAGEAESGEYAETQRTGRELCEELRKAREDYNMATGTISSLHRQLEIQESQLRRVKSEKEMLQKQLREREHQLQAMSAKFCNLREEWKHKGMMAAIEEENCSLRQIITDQESKLAEQKQQIGELQGTLNQLQAELLASQHHSQQQQRAQEESESRAEMLEHRELQAKVALEALTIRFERYRNKIIQAVFSTAGSKAPQAELTDEEVLKAMQEIVNERLEFHKMLEQKGIAVPPLYSINTATSSPVSANGR